VYFFYFKHLYITLNTKQLAEPQVRIMTKCGPGLKSCLQENAAFYFLKSAFHSKRSSLFMRVSPLSPLCGGSCVNRSVMWWEWCGTNIMVYMRERECEQSGLVSMIFWSLQRASTFSQHSEDV